MSNRVSTITLNGLPIEVKDIYAREEAEKAVQTIKIDNVEQTKTNNTVNLPAYPTKESLGISDVENKSSEEIRNELTAENVIAALGYTPADEAEKGQSNGLAELDENGRVPTSQLPSYVDDVVAYETKAEFPLQGESGKIYLDQTTNIIYRWNGSGYTEISPSLALGTTAATAFYGDKGQEAYVHAVTNKGAAFEQGFYKVTTNAEGHVTNAVSVTKSDILATGIEDTDTTYVLDTGDANGQIKVIPSDGEEYNVDVKGLGSAAYTDTDAYATVAQGEKADNAIQEVQIGDGEPITAEDGKVNIPAYPTKESLGLENVENKSADEILDELTKQDIIDKLEYTPATAAQGEKADSAVQAVAIDNVEQPKENGVVNLPAYPTKESLGLENVENKSAAEIIGELTAEDVVAALDYTPATSEQGDKADSAVQKVKVNGTEYSPTSGLVTLPDYPTKTSLGLDKVENKTSAEIRGELTSENVVAALGFTPADEAHIEDTNTTYTLETGSANGTLTLKGSDGGDSTNIAVKGLGSAAYTDSSAYATAAQGSKAASSVQKITVNSQDYTPTNGIVSLPDYPTGNVTGSNLASDNIITGNGNSAIKSSGKTIATSVTNVDSTVPTSKAVKSYVDSTVDTAISNLPEPMVFRGSLGTGGTITSLPTNGTASVGDTYKVITAATYNGQAAKVGDLFICDSKTANANTWTYIPSADEPSGTVTSVTIKGSSPIVVDSESAITSSGTRTISHANSGATAGSYGDSSAQTPDYGTTFKVPYVKVDKYGHVTEISDHTVKIPVSDNTDTWRNIKVDGTEKLGTNTSTGAINFVGGNNVTLSYADNSITIAAKDTTYSDATTSTSGLMSSSDKTKINGISSGAEVNQNAFSNVKVGNTTIAADTKTDTLELVASSNITLTPDATNDKITIAATDTDRYVNTASFAHDSTNNNVKMTLTRAGSDTATVTANIPKVSSTSAGVAPKGAAVSSQSQTTKFLREDGTWAAPSYTTAANTISAMTGYSKPSSTSAISTSDTLNAAIGKLEKALDSKANTIDLSDYLPLTGGTMSGDLTFAQLKGLRNNNNSGSILLSNSIITTTISDSNGLASVELNNTNHSVKIRSQIGDEGTGTENYIEIKNTGAYYNGSEIATTNETSTLNKILSQSMFIIPDGTETIEYSTITDKTKSFIYIPDSVEQILTGAFAGCHNLISINIPNSARITGTGEDVFENCFNLRSVCIPNGVMPYAIGRYCFKNCKSLKCIDLPEDIYEIRDNSFENCESLMEITIPNSVSYIGTDVFSGCTQLKTITIENSQGSISGAPWGAPNATVIWTG